MNEHVGLYTWGRGRAISCLGRAFWSLMSAEGQRMRGVCCVLLAGGIGLRECPVVYTALDQLGPRMRYLAGDSDSQGTCLQLAVGA